MSDSVESRNSVEIHTLMERISAQTDVHEKYTKALIQIIEQLDDISDRIVETEQSDQEYFRYLLEKVVEVGAQLRLFAEASRESEKLLHERVLETNQIIQGFVEVVNIFISIG